MSQSSHAGVGQVVETSRARIRAAAVHLFGRFGYDGVSLQMLADEVGLHKSTLFHHYRGKLEIAIDVFEMALERVVELLRPLERQPANPQDLFACSDALTDWFCAEPDMARLLMGFVTKPEGSALVVPEPSRSADLERTLYTLLGSWLDRARRAHVVRDLNLRQTMVNFVGLAVFYPAVALHLAGGQIAGPNAFSARAVAIRKRELRFALAGMLGLDPPAAR